MNQFPFLDETKYEFDPAAATSESKSWDSAHSLMGINAQVK